jgi:hypothetical protein
MHAQDSEVPHILLAQMMERILVFPGAGQPAEGLACTWQCRCHALAAPESDQS